MYRLVLINQAPQTITQRTTRIAAQWNNEMNKRTLTSIALSQVDLFGGCKRNIRTHYRNEPFGQQSLQIATTCADRPVFSELHVVTFLKTTREGWLLLNNSSPYYITFSFGRGGGRELRKFGRVCIWKNFSFNHTFYASYEKCKQFALGLSSSLSYLHFVDRYKWMKFWGDR